MYRRCCDMIIMVLIILYGGRKLISYNKLWKKMIDLNMKKKDLKELTGIGSTTMTKLVKNKSVSMDVMVKICLALKCNIGDIMDVLICED